MNRSLILFVFFSIAITINSASTQNPQTVSGSDPRVAAGLKELHHLASDVLKLDFGKIEKEGGEKNLVGFRSKDVLFSKRTDSRTYFIEDARFQVGTGSGIIEDPDEQVIEISRKIVDSFGVPSNEIANAKVLTQHLQTAQYEKTKKTLLPGTVKKGKRYVEMTRKIRNVPVFSSRAWIGLTRSRGVGSLEVHWPEIPEKAVAEAEHLMEIVKAGWKPPEEQNATVESVEAGIIHSPAVGFVMDIYPAIRVIYAPSEKQMGKKPVRYLDANGKSVPIPRTFEKSDEPPLTRKRTVNKS